MMSAATSARPLDRSSSARPPLGRPMRPGDAALPVALPEGHVGPVVLPGTNRHVYWTGRVAIGLLYDRGRERAAVGQSALWVQDLMLDKRGEPRA